MPAPDLYDIINRQMNTSQNINFILQDKGKLSSAILKLGFKEFLPFAEYICSLHYGRITYSQNIMAVIHERKGTCSSKHLLLASLAHECGYTDIHLMVGIYKMSEKNTPGVGQVLQNAGLEYIPEAHAYLDCQGKRFDFTGLKTGEESPFHSLISEQPVTLSKLKETKEILHRIEIAKFAKRFNLDPQRVWETREACIKALVE
jgi:hypothetical protein